MKKEKRVIEEENKMVTRTLIRSRLPDRTVATQHTTATSSLPTGVQQGLEEAGLNHRPILLGIDTDISLDGRLVREWLVVTGDQLTVVTESAVGDTNDTNPIFNGVPARVVRTLSWREVKQVQTIAGIGGGTLQLRVASGWIDLIRYSNALATRFHKVSRALEQAHDRLENDATLWIPPLAETIDPPRCRTCNLRLANSEDACPRCMQKGQIVRRVSQLLAPYTRGAILLCGLTLLGVMAELAPPKLQQYMVDNILSGQAAATGPTGTAGSGAVPDFKTSLLVVVLALAFSRVVLSIVGGGWRRLLALG